MQSFDYWEREFIRRGGEEMRQRSMKAELDTIKRVLGDEVYEEAILSEKPLSDLGLSIRIEPPRLQSFMHIEYPWDIVGHSKF